MGEDKEDAIELAEKGLKEKDPVMKKPEECKRKTVDVAMETPENAGPIIDMYHVEGENQVTILKQLLAFGGSTFSYSTLQNGIHYFIVPGVGYVPYSFTRSLPRMTIVLADPMSEPKHYRFMVEAFLKAHGYSMFLAINEQFASVLSGMGFQINTMGGETEMNAQTFTYSGYAKRSLRQTVNHAREAGVTVEELGHDIPDHIVEQLKLVNNDWLNQKHMKKDKMWFINRQPVFRYEEGVRKWVAWQDGKIEAMVFFDPMYEAGHPYGYYANIVRSTQEAHSGALQLIIQSAMGIFKKEGVRALSLGLCPFHNLEYNPFPQNQQVYQLMSFASKHGGDAYNYSNISSTKSKYGGGWNDVENTYTDPAVDWIPKFMAHKVKIPIYEFYWLVKMLKANGAMLTLKGWVDHQADKSNPVQRFVLRGFSKLLSK